MQIRHAAFVAARSFLFVPADRPERYRKALDSGADVVIIDLEDAVKNFSKEVARRHLAQAFDAFSEDLQLRDRIAIRINPVDGIDCAKDMALVRALKPGAVVLPKAESADLIGALSLPEATCLLLIIESAEGWHSVHELATLSAVVRLIFGPLDFQLDMGLQCGDDEMELQSVRLDLVAASRRAGLAPPVDGATLSLRDADLVARSTERALRLGFTGKLCLHPAQIDAVHAAFAPSDEALKRAQRLVDAAQQSGAGAVMVDGAMVDRPVVELAKRLLARRVQRSS